MNGGNFVIVLVQMKIVILILLNQIVEMLQVVNGGVVMILGVVHILQMQLVLLQKTLFNIEGLGRQLYPDLNLWETAKPYLERWMRDQFGPAALIRSLRRELPRLVPMIPELPAISLELLRQARDQGSMVPTNLEDLQQLRFEMRRRHRQLLGTLAGGAILLAGAIGVGVVSTPGIGQSWGVLAGGLLVIAGLVMLIIHWPRDP